MITIMIAIMMRITITIIEHTATAKEFKLLGATKNKSSK